VLEAVTAACKVADNPRVLVITLRRLGDVLLTTPLVHALRQGLKGARVDMLVFDGTERILDGNPDIDRVIAIPQKPTAAQMSKLMVRLWRRYDLAVTTQTGDRPTLLAMVAGRVRIGVVPEGKQAWKRWVLSRSITTDPSLHRVVELNRLAGLIGIDERPQIVVPKQEPGTRTPRAPYAVLHANPMYRIRRWTDAGWRALTAALRERGLEVVVTGGPSADERNYLDHIWDQVTPPVERADGRLEWAELADLLAGAAVYVGPDTSMTHLAAAAGCPTVAIYGPASPHGMGPWPIGGLERPWARAGTIQNRSNVWVVQNPLPCMPCDRLGCDNHLESRSECLDTLSVAQVLRAVDLALGRGVSSTPKRAAKPAGTASLPLTPPGSV
jgi:lipopolysaccharide heptosyltransferase III